MLAPLLLIMSLAAQPPTDSAVLRAGLRPVLVMRASLGVMTPTERAAAAQQRLRSALEAGYDSVSVQPLASGNLVMLDAHPVFAVLPGDVDSLAAATLETTTAAAVQDLSRAVAEYYEARSARSLLEGSGLALAATLLFLLLLRLLIRGRRRVTDHLDRLVMERLRDVRVGNLTVLDRNQVRIVERSAIATMAWVAGLLLTYGWATFILKRFPWTRHLGEVLGTFLWDTAALLVGGIVRQLPNLFTAILIFVLVRLAARALNAVFDGVERGAITLPGIHPETVRPTRRVAVALLWLFGIVLAFPFIPGSETTAFKGVSVFAGLLLTLGSSSVVGQAMSGLTLMYSRALREGDYVRVGETEGVVTEVGMLSTKVRTPKMEEVTLPSSVVLGSAVKNFSRLRDSSGTVILTTTVTIGYDAPWRQVHALLLAAARETELVSAEPAPFVLQRALQDFYVEYELNVHTTTPERRPWLLAELHRHIQDQFNAHGVQIMSPHYLGDPGQAKVVPKAQWFAPPAEPEPPAR